MITQPTSPPAPRASQTSGLAITSLICGIASFIILVIPAIIAIICGHTARSRINKSNGILQGKGLALAGLICGYTSITLIIATGTWIAFEVKESARTHEKLTAEDIRRGQQIHTLVLQYESDHGKFPDTLGELVTGGYIQSLDPLQPTRGDHWVYFTGQTSKSYADNFLIRSDEDIVIFINGSGEAYSVGSWTTEPVDSRMRGNKKVRE